jgi:hypothetical protein
VADKNEADIKNLRGQVEALSRRLEALEKGSRAGPDPAAIAKMATRLEALEKAVANKKDMKPEHEQALKVAMKSASESKEFATKAMLDARLKTIEAKVDAALRK